MAVFLIVTLKCVGFYGRTSYKPWCAVTSWSGRINSPCKLHTFHIDTEAANTSKVLCWRPLFLWISIVLSYTYMSILYIYVYVYIYIYIIYTHVQYTYIPTHLSYIINPRNPIAHVNWFWWWDSCHEILWFSHLGSLFRCSQTSKQLTIEKETNMFIRWFLWFGDLALSEDGVWVYNSIPLF